MQTIIEVLREHAPDAHTELSAHLARMRELGATADEIERFPQWFAAGLLDDHPELAEPLGVVHPLPPWPDDVRGERCDYEDALGREIPIPSLAELRGWLQRHRDGAQAVAAFRKSEEARQRLWNATRDGYLWLRHFTGQERPLPYEPKSLDDAEAEMSRLLVMLESPFGEMTEPLTKLEIAKWFRIGRNSVPAFLKETPHVLSGSKVRLPIRIMPPDYLTKNRIPVSW